MISLIRSLFTLLAFIQLSHSFSEASDRTKRRKTEELRATTPSNQIYFAAKVALQKEGKRAAAKLLEEATTASNDTPIKILNVYRKSLKGTDKVVRFTEDEALAHMIKCRLTKESYKITRLAMKERKADVFPSYDKIRAAKRRCYPSNDDINITNLGKVNMKNSNFYN